MTDKLRDAWNLECSKFASYMDHTKKGFYGDPVSVPGKVVRYAFWGRRTHKEEFPLHFWLACILLTIQWGNMEI